MKFELTRVHLAHEHAESGVQFDILDATGARSRQRAFVVVDPALLAPVWAAAEKAVGDKLGELPLDLPPASVTAALMKQREAEAAARAAHHDRERAEKAAQDAETARLQAESAARQAAAQCEECTAEVAKLEQQIAARKAELEALG